jgi:hypothetical protein
MKMNGHFCFCTLALGRKYCNRANQLASDLERFSPKEPFLVLTDNPSIFKNSKNVIAIKHRQRSVLGYNDKLCVVNKALERFDTCIFLDADLRIFETVHLPEEIFQPGLRAYKIRTWEYTKREAEPLDQPWKRENLRIMGLLRSKFGLAQDDNEILFVVECLFSITKGERTDAFLQKWNELANFCETNGFFFHLGFSIGLAGQLTEFPILESNFTGVKFFYHRMSPEDVKRGIISQSEYDYWNARADDNKDIKWPMSYRDRCLTWFIQRGLLVYRVFRSWLKPYRRKRYLLPSREIYYKGVNSDLRKIAAQMRFLKVRLFGLNLIKKKPNF